MTAPKRLGVVSLILALGALGLAGWTWTAVRHSDTTTQLESTEQDKAELETEAETAADQVLALCAGNGKVALKLRQAGVCADSKRLRIITREGKPGRPPTDAEIALAVADYCSGRVCAPSEAEIAAQVRAYCNARDDCLGERGRDGQDGAAGADGEDGDDGRPPTDAEIAAEVAAYCAERNECRGAAGQDGQDGEDGRDGTDGQDGVDGQDGTDGKDGKDRPMCPDGYHGEETTHNGREAFVCYRDGESSPPDPGG